jgi:hypothetical protein
MKSPENYSFPSEAELKEIREKTSSPNYPYKNKILPVDASAKEKFKYQICQAILVYQQENNLPVEEMAKKIEIPLNKTYDILLGKIKGFQLKELANYLEKLQAPFEITVRSDKVNDKLKPTGAIHF